MGSDGAVPRASTTLRGPGRKECTLTSLCLKPSGAARMRPRRRRQALLEAPGSAGVATVCLPREPSSRPRPTGESPVSTIPAQRPRPPACFLPSGFLLLGWTRQFPWRVFCGLGLSSHCEAFILRGPSHLTSPEPQPGSASLGADFMQKLLFSRSVVRLFATPWTAAHQASLSFTIFWSLLKLMSVELVMPSNLLILCHPFLLLPSIFPSIRVFSN